jgi:Cysteine rich repeat
MAHRIAGSFVIMATLFCVPAFAQSGAEFNAACGKDVRRFCNGVQPGGGRILQCFRAHRGELSAQCRSLFAEMRATAAQRSTPSTPPDMPEAAPPPSDQYEAAPPPSDQYGASSGSRMTGAAY